MQSFLPIQISVAECQHSHCTLSSAPVLHDTLPADAAHFDFHDVHRFRRLAAGDWGHVFPEGGVWQRPGCLGGRENGKEDEIGHLKWSTWAWRRSHHKTQ
jgi:hypothetical protein